MNGSKLLRCLVRTTSLECKLISVRSVVTNIGPGPDRVLPADKYTTTRPDEPVKIRSSYNGYEIPPQSLWSMLQETVSRVPDRTALAVKRNGDWVKWTFDEYLRDVKLVAKAFIKLGLEPHHGVGISGHNAPEWHISNIASIVAGGLACGIYTTNCAEVVEYKLRHSRANIVVVEDQEQLDKVLEKRDK